MKDKEKMQFSKIIVILAIIIFILTLLHCFSLDSESLDLSSATAELTIAGGFLSSVCIWYYKKSQVENVAKQRLTHAKSIAAIEYEYWEKKMLLKHKLNIDDDSDINDSTILDEMLNDSIVGDDAYLKSKQEDAESDPEINI